MTFIFSLKGAKISQSKVSSSTLFSYDCALFDQQPPQSLYQAGHVS